MEKRRAKFSELQTLETSGKEGAVFYELADSLDTIADQVVSFWKEQGALTKKDATTEEVVAAVFEVMRPTRTEDGHVAEEPARDIVLVFADDAPINICKLAMVRLAGPSCSWLSDYVPNNLMLFSDAGEAEMETVEVCVRKSEYVTIEYEFPKGISDEQKVAIIRKDYKNKDALNRVFGFSDYVKYEVVNDVGDESFEICSSY